MAAESLPKGAALECRQGKGTEQGKGTVFA